MAVSSGLTNFAQALNAEQLAAVTAPDGPLFVLAAAGTGKTRTLVYRVAYLVQQGVDARRILLLTFTNRAAREMLARAQILVGEQVGGLWGGTFHHLANRMLRRYAPLLNFGADFTILDHDDSISLIKDLITELKLGGKQFPKAEVLLSLLSGAVNRRQALDAAVQRYFEKHPIDPEDALRVFARYQQKKRAQNAMDFDDLIINGLQLLKEHPGVLAHYQEQFRYVLVDEYQDTNPIQADWVDLLAQRHRNLLVVGDDFQSIYAWRGADYRNIMTFPQRYADTRIFKLETNYRSTPEILAVANRCIAGNPHQFQKVLRATRPAHHKPVLVSVADGAHQARYVIGQLVYLRNAGRAWRDMVVLYRAHYHALELQMELTRARIPFTVVSGVRFFEQAHVKDVLSLLRILHNPGDELAFARFLSLLPGVSSRTAAKVWRSLGGRWTAGNAKARSAVAGLLPKAARAVWQTLLPIFETYESLLRKEPAEIIAQFSKIFYDEYLLDTFDDYERRQEDLAEVMEFMAGFASTDDFLNEVALVTNLDAEGDRLAGNAQDSLRLSTVHQAKGLEWNVVFVLWLADGLFPSSRAMLESGEDAEERRLFYVAVTRAKDELFLCAPAMRRALNGGIQFLEPSRFVKELPPDCLRQEKTDFL
ncbi:MAG: ATP-dependent helicase [Lentisphaerae bacterium]|nr:ATP-dependent helicase [Lentisphaerota bacterium]